MFKFLEGKMGNLFTYTKIAMLVMLLGYVTFDIIRKEVIIVLDGEEIEYVTNALFNQDVINETVNNYELTDVEVASDTEGLVSENSKIVLNTLKNFTIVIGDNEYQQSTYLNSYEEFLKENPEVLSSNIKDNEEVKVITEKSSDDTIVNDAKYYYNVEKTEVETEKTYYDLPVVYTDSDTLFEGQEVVKTEGSPKVIEKTYKLTYENNELLDKIQTESKTVDEGTNKVVLVGTKKRVSDTGTWDALAYCEATGNWSMDSGNGYYGGLQIAKGTWDAYRYKLGITAEFASQATKDEQIAVGQLIQQSQGWGAWPYCSSKLGL